MSLQQMNHPKMILFREIMLQLLEAIRRQNKRSRLDDLDLPNHLAQDTRMDPTKYSEHLITGLANPKSRDQTLSYLEKLYREDAVARGTFPKDLLASLIKSCEPEGSSLSMCRFLGALLTNEDTRVSNEDKERALLYLLAANRSKLLNTQQVQSILLDVFSFLAPRSEPEIKTFLAYYLNWITNQVDLHSAQDIEYTLQLHKHQNIDFGYGRCFMCNNIAKNYHKEMKIPICGLQCKDKFTRLQEKAENRETFNLFDWLIEQSVNKDEIIFREIEKELRAVMKNLTERQLRILFPELLIHAKGGNKEMALLCHRIFVGLFHGHKQMLKKELGSYLKEMINQLETAKDSNEVFSLLQLFQELYKQPDNISWIYANFDCKYYEVNLLEEQLALLSKISIGEQFGLAKQAKACLTVLLRSLLERLRGIRVNNDEALEEEGLLEERKIKQKAEHGIRLFNSKPKVGIQYLRQNYFQGEEMTIADVARFIRQNQSTQFRGGRLKLKKDKIGEFFQEYEKKKKQPSQEDEPYNIKVYKAFLELLDFEGLSIDDALRELLSHFTLGKQAQQIQRMVDYFSQRYFPYSGLADVNSCFTLSYAILMLQSNLHNPRVEQKLKMTPTGFVQLCSAVQGISRQSLERLYASIKNSQLSEKPQLSSEYLLEKAYLNAYDTSEQPGDLHVQSVSLLNSIWQYIYVGLVDRKNVEGLEEAVILYGSYNMASETQGFLRYLSKLAEEGIIEAYDVLLRLAAKSINSLGVHFHLILKFVFEMEEGSISYQSSLDSSIVDMIFTSTVSLPDEKFIQLLQSFCNFAYSNIHDTKYSRELFVLKHLIEIVDYNVSRMAALWPERILSDFFIRMGLHPKQAIAMAAVDSLKQVVLKLIKVPESPHFEQKKYMSLFVDIFDRSNEIMKELIVSILGMCVGKDLKSGWEVVFDILQKAENQAVIRVINRIVEVGLENVIDQKGRLHSIIINKVALGPVSELSLDLLVKITQFQFYNTQEHWLSNLRTIRDKFKATLNLQVLGKFFVIVKLLKFQNSELFQQVQNLNLFAAEAGVVQSQEVFAQTNNLEPKFLLSQYSKLKQLWATLLNSPNQRIYLQHFQEQIIKLGSSMTAPQLQQTYEFLVERLRDSNPRDLLEIKKLDADFEKLLENLPSQETGTDLIELDLEKEHFYFQGMLHVVLLETTVMLVQKAPPGTSYVSQLLAVARQSHDLSHKFNSRVLLRLFLWKNGFLKGNKLPGLAKQQLLSLNLLTVLCAAETIEARSEEVIKQHLKLHELLKEIPKSSLSPSLREMYREEINLKIYNMKGVLIKLLSKIGSYDSFTKPKDMYNLILDLMDVVGPPEIIRAGQVPLQKLLELSINSRSE